MENITKTFNSIRYYCLSYDRLVKKTIENSFILNKDLSDDAAIKVINKKYAVDGVTVVDIIGKETVSEKRTMSVDTFMKYAVALDKPNPSLVTRTIKSIAYDAVVYDKVLKETAFNKLTLDKAFDDDEKALKALQKRYNGDTMVVVDVLGKTTNEQLFGITPDEFINHSKVISDDSVVDE